MIYKRPPREALLCTSLRRLSGRNSSWNRGPARVPPSASLLAQQLHSLSLTCSATRPGKVNYSLGLDLQKASRETLLAHHFDGAWSVTRRLVRMGSRPRSGPNTSAEPYELTASATGPSSWAS